MSDKQPTTPVHLTQFELRWMYTLANEKPVSEIEMQRRNVVFADKITAADKVLVEQAQAKQAAEKPEGGQ